MDVDTRKAECGKKLFSRVYNEYYVPTKNRFSGLEDNYPGNYYRGVVGPLILPPPSPPLSTTQLMQILTRVFQTLAS